MRWFKIARQPQVISKVNLVRLFPRVPSEIVGQMVNAVMLSLAQRHAKRTPVKRLEPAIDIVGHRLGVKRQRQRQEGRQPIRRLKPDSDQDTVGCRIGGIR